MPRKERGKGRKMRKEKGEGNEERRDNEGGAGSKHFRVSGKPI